ncbi:MAG: glycosyltransferase [Spirulina sp. SIO3F2]|nr:glycosyltransferase [Spirulina sp. SIO3F2]
MRIADGTTVQPHTVRLMFTIVITTYNRLPLLKRAIARSLEQTIGCEVLVVDDGSSDGTQAYCEALAEESVHFRYHRNPSNQGHAKSVNIGVELAQGTWIKLLDDDDYLALNCIEQLEAAITCHLDAVICSVQAAQVTEDEAELSVTKPVGNAQLCALPQPEIHYGMLLEQVPFGTPVQVAFERDAFLKTGGWDSQFDTNFDDIDSWVKIAEHGDALFLNQCLAYRTVWPGAYNYRFSLRDRLLAHKKIKHAIYDRIAPVHQRDIPSRKTVKQYLQLHWGLVALKQKRILGAIALLIAAMGSISAWRLFFRCRRPPAGLLQWQVITPA